MTSIFPVRVLFYFNTIIKTNIWTKTLKGEHWIKKWMCIRPRNQLTIVNLYI